MTGEEHALSVLAQVAGIPTAPFHEEAVARHLSARLQACGLTVRQDRFGNLLARYRRGHGARPVALVAHMDHPGLVVTHVAGHEVTADVLGGLRAGVLAPGTAVRFYAGAASHAGTVQEYIPAAAGRRAAIRAGTAGPIHPQAFGTLDIAALDEQDGVLSLRAADDLAQCACLLLVAEQLAATTTPVDVTFVLTRAEEIGLVGATLVARAGLVARDAIVVSLECSKALPGAEIGKGPVIRVGDARQSFDPRGEALLLAARDALLRRRAELSSGPGGTVQRQLMSGGSCEASAFQAYGYMTTGVVLPLGNYHNADLNDLAAPEVIHVSDLVGEVDLLLATLAESSHPVPERRGRFEALADAASPRLVATAAGWNLGVPPERGDIA